MRLNILHIDTEKTWRGGERQAFFLMKLLPKDTAVSFLAAPEGSPLFLKAQQEHIDVIPFSIMGEWDLFAARRLSRLVEQYRIDLVHAHASHALGVAAAGKIFNDFLLVASRRVDYHLHGNIFTRWKYRQADMIIAISDAVKQILIEDGIPPEMVRVVKSGVEYAPIVSAPNTPAARNALGVPLGNRIVGIVGALSDQKDHDTFIEAAALIVKKIENISFLIIGEGEKRKHIETLIDSKGLRRAVIMTGFRTDVIELIGMMDVYVVSSAYEGLGTSTLDAMHCSKPVVATHVGGIPEIVDDGRTGFLVPKGDYIRMAEKIIYFLEHSGEALAMGEAGKKKSQEFTAEKTASGTAEVYKNLIENGGARNKT